jgi:hypothetical protein
MIQTLWALSYGSTPAEFKSDFSPAESIARLGAATRCCIRLVNSRWPAYPSTREEVSMPTKRPSAGHLDARHSMALLGLFCAPS